MSWNIFAAMGKNLNFSLLFRPQQHDQRWANKGSQQPKSWVCRCSHSCRDRLNCVEELNRILDFFLSFFCLFAYRIKQFFTSHSRWEMGKFQFFTSPPCCCCDESFSLVIVRICDPHEGIQIFSYPILLRTFSHNSISAVWMENRIFIFHNEKCDSLPLQILW